jgi:hypothetical protein
VPFAFNEAVILSRNDAVDVGFLPSFPNFVWERRCLGNSVSFPQNSKQSFAAKCVPKQSLGTRKGDRPRMARMIRMQKKNPLYPVET